MHTRALASLLIVVTFVAAASAAPVDPPDDFSVFGLKKTTLHSKVTVRGCSVGSNGDVTVQGESDILLSLTGGGKLDGGQKLEIWQDVIFDGDLKILGESIVHGNVDGSADVTLGSKTHVMGDVTAGGNVDVGGESEVDGDVLADGNCDIGQKVKIHGEVGANGNVKILGNTTVDGAVTYGVGKTYTEGTGVTIGSPPPVQGVTSVVPVTYTPHDLWDATTFTAGGVDTTTGGEETVVLPPGSYGALDLGQKNKLYLSSGEYRFTQVDVLGETKLYLDLSGGGLTVLVEGPVEFGQKIKTYIDDGTGGGYEEMALADFDLARDVYWETHSTWKMLGESRLFGTVYGPNDKVYFGSKCHIVGAVFSGTEVEILGESEIDCRSYFGPGGTGFLSGEPVPEPAGLALIGLAALGLTLRKHR